jgi:hypothetical protein
VKKKEVSMKLILIALSLMAMLMAGCKPEELNDGYQVGDLSHLTIREISQLEQARKEYCDANADAIIRKAALAYIRVKFPVIPENGICHESDR